MTPEALSALDACVSAIAAAATSRRLYGPDHPAVAKQLTRATDALSRATLIGASLDVLLLDDRLVAGDRSLPCGPVALSAGLAAIRNRGVGALRLGGASANDLRSLMTIIAENRDATSEDPASRMLVRGEVGFHRSKNAADDRDSESADESARVTNALASIWSGIERQDPTGSAALTSVVSQLTTATAAGSGSLLRIAKLKQHDDYTYVHTTNVALLSSALARACGVTGEKLESLTSAALLHDLGKSYVPPAILSKNASLSRAEQDLVRAHPAAGAALLAGAPGVPDLAPIVAYEHHMQLDGGGYPARPARWKLSFASQVVQVADIFDALRTHRPYRAAIELGKSLEILSAMAGSAFDRDLFRVFAEHVVRPAEAGRTLQELGPRTAATLAA